MAPKPKISTDWIAMEKCHRNGYDLLMQGLHSIVRIAQGKETRYALEAGQWLVAYGERLLSEKAAASRKPLKAFNANRDEIIAELRGLYAQALGEGRQPVAPLAAEVVDVEAQPAEPPARRD